VILLSRRESAVRDFHTLDRHAKPAHNKKRAPQKSVEPVSINCLTSSSFYNVGRLKTLGTILDIEGDAITLSQRNAEKITLPT